MAKSGHVDTFARDNLPPRSQWPVFLFELQELKYPARMNCATELLDKPVTRGHGHRIALRAPEGECTYTQLFTQANRLANVLVREMDLRPGNRVLLRGPNHPMMAACWFAVMKAGGVCVATMPLLRAKELTEIINKAEISHALCDKRLAEELEAAAGNCLQLKNIKYWYDDAPDSLDTLAARQPLTFTNVPTAADDPALIAFTSGTTGKPKGTVHFHRDVMAVCACWPPHVLRATPDDVFIGSPPLALTFGLGGLMLFPMRVGASTVLLEKAGPRELLEAIPAYGATVLFTAPTAYRGMAEEAGARRLTTPLGGSLRKSVSAGEALPAVTRALWKHHTGLDMIDGLGSTEMLHIFISSDEAHARPGATGTAVPGYRACIMDDDGHPVPPGTVGHLAVKGPTGCRYLADERQATYVKDGWNYTGDAYLMDADGYFHFQARTDDMIVSAGYNIGALEVEEALMRHPAVAECAVIGEPDAARGHIVKAFVVPREGHTPSEALVRELQDFVKRAIAPYKYPRAIAFRQELPRGVTDKLQRFKLREG
jgi:2-aminobenzoate-CoA ligase